MRDMAAALQQTLEMPALPFRISLPGDRPSGPRLIAPSPAGISSVPPPAPSLAARTSSAPVNMRAGAPGGFALKLGIAAALLVCAAIGFAATGGANGAP